MDKVEEVTIYANKQEGLLVEMLRRYLNNELTIEYQKRVIEELKARVEGIQVLEATVRDLQNVVEMQRKHISEVESHLTAARAAPAAQKPGQRRKVKDAQSNSA